MECYGDKNAGYRKKGSQVNPGNTDIQKECEQWEGEQSDRDGSQSAEFVDHEHSQKVGWELGETWNEVVIVVGSCEALACTRCCACLWIWVRWSSKYIRMV